LNAYAGVNQVGSQTLFGTPDSIGFQEGVVTFIDSQPFNSITLTADANTPFISPSEQPRNPLRCYCWELACWAWPDASYAA
jgi:hypothetical protein